MIFLIQNKVSPLFARLIHGGIRSNNLELLVFPRFINSCNNGLQIVQVVHISKPLKAPKCPYNQDNKSTPLFADQLE